MIKSHCFHLSASNRKRQEEERSGSSGGGAGIYIKIFGFFRLSLSEIARESVCHDGGKQKPGMTAHKAASDEIVYSA